MKKKLKKAAPVKGPAKKSSTTDWIEKYSTHIFLVLLFLIALYVFNDYLFFRKLYLFKDIGSDTINAFYPIFVNTADYIRSYGMPKWSFNTGIGQNIHSFILRDPFQVILYALGKNNLAYGIVYVELIKVLGSGILFYYYLKTLAFTRFSALMGGLLYSFSGFMIIGSAWYVFSTEAFSMALLLLAFERFYKLNSWVLLPLAVFVICVTMPFNLFPMGLFLFFYIILRHTNDHGFRIRSLAVLYSKLLVISLLGVALSSFFLFSNVLQLIESPRVSGGASYASKLLAQPIFAFGDKIHNITSFLRFFSNDVLGTGNYFKGWYNYLEAPAFYCGILTLLLVPQIFSYVDKRKKAVFIIFIMLWLLPIVFPFFRHAFWIFTGDYYRIFGLLVAIVLLFYALYSLTAVEKEDKKINVPVLVITSTVLIFALLFAFRQYPSGFFYQPHKNIIILLILLYTVLLVFFNNKEHRPYLKVIICLLVGVELAYFSHPTVNKRSVISASEFKDRTGYKDYTLEAIEHLNKTDSSFFRVDKNYSSGPAMHGSLNDGMMQDYKGTSSYYSFNNKYYIKFLEGTNVINTNSEFESRWAPGLRGRALLESITGVKYVLSKQRDNSSLRFSGFDSVAQLGDVRIFSNRYYLPLGFCYNKWVRERTFKRFSPTQKDFTLLRAFVADSGTEDRYKALPEYLLSDSATAYTWDDLAKDIGSLRTDTLQITNWDHNNIKGRLDLSETKMLFFSIPFEGGWKIKINGKPEKLEKINFGFLGILLDKGHYDVELQFLPRYYKAGMLLSVISLVLYILAIFRERLRKRKESTPGAGSF